MLLKVHDETPTETIKPKLIKKAKQKATREKLLKRESMLQENVREKRTRDTKIRHDYSKITKEKIQLFQQLVEMYMLFERT